MARALDLHSRGHRFDSDILHAKAIDHGELAIEKLDRKEERTNKRVSSKVERLSKDTSDEPMAN